LEEAYGRFLGERDKWHAGMTFVPQ
jgi:hypothetical protein